MNAYVRVYQALDLALSNSERAVAPGTEAAVQAALAELRAQDGATDAIETLQQLSVDLARLNGALRVGDSAECRAQRARLAEIKDEWLRVAPLN